MKEYLKMSDVKDLFDGLINDGHELWCEGGWIGEMLNHDCAKYASHAINSHDELVGEVDRLRKDNERLERMRKCLLEFAGRMEFGRGAMFSPASVTRCAYRSTGNLNEYPDPQNEMLDIALEFELKGKGL